MQFKVEEKREEIKEFFRKYFMESDDVEKLNKEIDNILISINNSAVINEHESEQKDELIGYWDKRLAAALKNVCGSVLAKDGWQGDYRDKVEALFETTIKTSGWLEIMDEIGKDFSEEEKQKWRSKNEQSEVRTRTGSYFTDTMGMLSPIHPPTPIDFSKAFKTMIEKGNSIAASPPYINTGQDRPNEKLSEEIARAGRWVDPISEILFSSLEENK